MVFASVFLGFSKRILFFDLRRIIMFRFIFCFLLITLVWYSETQAGEGRMDNVVRVFWHQSTTYSVLVDVGNNTYRIKSLPYYWPCGGTADTVSIISDVAPSNKMWVSWKTEDGSWGTAACLSEMSIHVHTPKDIGEGSWSCGKATCQTSVIE
jgi:hypothetical protein